VNIGKVIAAIWLRLDNVVVGAMAFIRAFIVKDGGANLGNFYRDLVRFTTRVLLPLSFVLSLFMIWQGWPQTPRRRGNGSPDPGRRAGDRDRPRRLA
jgi:Potassium-transporting ATPase A subunit